MAAIEMTGTINDMSEEDWLHATACNPAFSDLSEPEEDIYTLSDGKAFN